MCSLTSHERNLHTVLPILYTRNSSDNNGKEKILYLWVSLAVLSSSPPLGSRSSCPRRWYHRCPGHWEECTLCCSPACHPLPAFTSSTSSAYSGHLIFHLSGMLVVHHLSGVVAFIFRTTCHLQSRLFVTPFLRVRCTLKLCRQSYHFCSSRRFNCHFHHICARCGRFHTFWTTVFTMIAFRR